MNRAITTIRNIHEAMMPTKKEEEKLAKAFALNKYSALKNAPMKVQQKYYDEWTKLSGKFSAKYLDGQKFDADNLRRLENLADKWWNKQGIKGAGRHW